MGEDNMTITPDLVSSSAVIDAPAHSSKKLEIFACACVRVRTFKNFSRARACACAS